MRRLALSVAVVGLLAAAPAQAAVSPKHLRAQHKRATAQAKRYCRAQPSCRNLTVWWVSTTAPTPPDCSHWYFFFFTNQAPGWGWFESMQCGR